jgi:ComF family protein
MVWEGAGQGGDAAIAGLEPLRASSEVGRFIGGALDLLLPRTCVSCASLMSHRETGMVCSLCWSRLPILPSPQCQRCGHPLSGDACRWCELLPPFVRAVRSVCWVPAEPASGIVHALKYEGWANVADEIAGRMARLSWPLDVVEERAAVVPVPLASARKRQRGYNQSALIAGALGRRWRIPVWEHAVVRIRETESQTRLTPEQRLDNVAGSFGTASEGRQKLRGAHIVLVDDVVTTAATLNACAKVLYDAGARIISYVTFGRARASGDRL